MKTPRPMTMPTLARVLPKPSVIQPTVSTKPEPATTPVTMPAMRRATKASSRVASTSTTIVVMPRTSANSSCTSMVDS